MPNISIIICCANCADMIEAACRSAKWADELIVVDSGSTDNTGEIARRYADQYVVEPWRGYSAQKQFATDLARNDWIFILDGDEECSPALIEELTHLPQEKLDRHDLLLVPRRHYIMGRHVRAWQPDRITRLFHRGRCSWGGEALHDTRKASDPSRVGKLTGWIEHKRLSAAGFTDYFNGRLIDDRLMLIAHEMHEKGRRCHVWDLMLRPGAAFFKSLIIKRGLLDGVWGLMIAQKAATGVQLKYAALWAVQNGIAGDKKQETDAKA